MELDLEAMNDRSNEGSDGGRLRLVGLPLPRRRAGGLVSLVGAGPGDPGLLTLKAVDRLLTADIVYHDALVSEGVLQLIPPDTRRVPVGKRRGRHTLPQAQIQRCLVRAARGGLRVVRLKGGDPFLFGRGAEECLHLIRRGIPFEVIPGISAGMGVPALAGIPLTHRGISSSVAFVTAHDLGPGRAGQEVRHRLRHLARAVETLVVFMGGAMVGKVRRTLLDAGMPGETPAAAIANGTRADERRRITTLEEIHRLALTPSQGPVLLLFGPTVGLAETIRGAMEASRWEVEAAERLQQDDATTYFPAARPGGPGVPEETSHEPSAA